MAGFLGLGQKAAGEGIAGQGDDVAGGQADGVRGADEIVIHIATEIGRIVRVDGRPQAGRQHALERVVLQSGHPAQAQIGQRADRQRHAAVGEPAGQGGVFQRPVAMIEPVDLQQVQRLDDIVRRPLLAGMGDPLEAQRPRRVEHPLEFRRRMAQFRTVQSDALDPVQPGPGHVQGVKGGRLGQVAQEAQDEFRTHPPVRLGLVERPGNAGHDGVEGNAAVRMALRIEEDLDMAHIVGPHPLEIGPGEIEEILFGHQHIHADIIDVEKVLQVGEIIGRPDLLDARVGDVQTIAPGQGKHQLGLQRAFQVQVKLGLGQGLDEADKIVGHGGTPRGLAPEFMLAATSARPAGASGCAAPAIPAGSWRWWRG